MKKKITAFGASNSKQSINKKLAYFAASQLEDIVLNLLDLNDFEMPIYSVDRERESGIPMLAHHFKDHIKSSNGIILSLAEHNGAYSTAFKNIFDWLSRIEKNTWSSKPMFLLATSPGERGGKTVLDMATNRFKRMNQNVVASFSLPSFNINFSEQEGITNQVLLDTFRNQLKIFETAL